MLQSVNFRYVQQFKEIFTEEGRLAVKITKQVPGQAPVIEYTQTSSTSSGITISGAQAVLGTHHISSSTSGVGLHKNIIYCMY